MRTNRSYLMILLLILSYTLHSSRPINAQSSSPQLAFVKNAQIMLIRSDGTEQTNVSNSESSDSQPNWSPDGKQLVFVSDRLAEGYEKTLGSRGNLFMMNADGSDVKSLTDGKDQDSLPAFSPDGQQIAFARRSATYNPVEPQIMIMSADGSAIEALAKSPDANPIGALAWFPDGKALTFTVVNQMDGSPLGTFRLDMASKEVTALPSDGASPLVTAGPAWSPVLNRGVFVRRETSRDADGELGYAILTSAGDRSAEALVLALPALLGEGQLLREVAALAWSPDGTLFAFDAPDPRFKRAAFRQVLVVGVDGKGLTLLTTDEQASSQSPVWRPQTP
jgi:Tol biopolymer transport system component